MVRWSSAGASYILDSRARPIALAVGAGGGGLFGLFNTPLSFPSSSSLSGRRPDID